MLAKTLRSLRNDTERSAVEQVEKSLVQDTTAAIADILQTSRTSSVLFALTHAGEAPFILEPTSHAALALGGITFAVWRLKVNQCFAGRTTEPKNFSAVHSAGRGRGTN